ncbi:MAG: DUF3025 domain-containing protein [Labilithrix sp.]|nr:DUF3025 domain-containing protein [Labilithrix sp.]MCW5818028.1 DUF3025 domain-containing protein [Labilithrix sp.]
MPAVADRIRKVRWERTAFDARFYTRHEDFWPIARAASLFSAHDDWPAVAEYNQLFAGEAPVRFEEAPLKRRRPRGEIDRRELYDARITHDRVVPTRPRMWHDFLNALVWATFPRAKTALHRRQHAAIERWIPPRATQLPNARTREQDALALVDEGGVLLVEGRTMLFGHALYEGHVFGQPAMVSRAVELAGAVDTADEELASMLDDPTRFRSPDTL